MYDDGKKLDIRKLVEAVEQKDLDVDNMRCELAHKDGVDRCG